MGKNKKNIAKSAIKILADGMLKIKKGKKVDLTPYIANSVEGCLMGTIEGVGRAGRRPKDDNITINNLMLPAPEALRILSTGFTESEFTLVDIVRLKDSNTFDLTDTTTRGEILRSSTLGGCYKEVKLKWKEINSVEYSKATNYLYFPDIVSFMNSDTGDVLHSPFKFNYLLVSVPSIGRFGYDDMDTYINNVIADIMDAIIEVKAKNVIIDPFTIKAFKENPEIVSNLFNVIAYTDKTKNYLDSITFTIPESDKFVTFISSQKNVIFDNINQVFERIKVATKEDDEPEHIFEVNKDDGDVIITETNIKKDGSLDIDAIVESDSDDE